MPQSDATPVSLPLPGPAFEWRAALGPWRRSLLGALGSAIGRPFLIDGAERLAPSRDRHDWYAAGSPRFEPGVARASLNAAVAQGWLDQALMEHASVAAFARFSLQLLELGAPGELVAASATAMQDEIRHARGCFELARRYSTRDVGPGPLPIDGVLDENSPAKIVLDALREGCIGETVAAIEAAEAMQQCEDPTAHALLQRIAQDESQHAELAWRFVAWALETRPELTERVRAAFARELAGVPAEPQRRPRKLSEADRELARHGLMSAPLRAALRLRVLAAVVAPCADALLAGAGWKSPEPDGPASVSPETLRPAIRYLETPTPPSAYPASSYPAAPGLTSEAEAAAHPA